MTGLSRISAKTLLLKASLLTLAGIPTVAGIPAAATVPDVAFCPCFLLLVFYTVADFPTDSGGLIISCAAIILPEFAPACCC